MRSSPGLQLDQSSLKLLESFLCCNFSTLSLCQSLLLERDFNLVWQDNQRLQKHSDTKIETTPDSWDADYKPLFTLALTNKVQHQDVLGLKTLSFSTSVKNKWPIFFCNVFTIHQFLIFSLPVSLTVPGHSAAIWSAHLLSSWPSSTQPWLACTSETGKNQQWLFTYRFTFLSTATKFKKKIALGVAHQV